MSSESEERAAVASASPQGFAPAFTDTLPSTPPPYSDISARTSYKEPLEDTPGIGGAEHSSAKNTILGIAVVDFVRSLLTRIILLDPQVEHACPRALLDDEDFCRKLPFLALPDGSHQVRLL